MVGFVIPIVRKPFGKLILEIEDVLAIRKYLSEQDRNTCLGVNNSQPLVPRFQCFNHKFRREKGECESSPGFRIHQLVQRFKDSRFKDSKIQRFEDSKIQRFKDSRFKDSKIQRFEDSKIQGFKDSNQRFKDSI